MVLQVLHLPFACKDVEFAMTPVSKPLSGSLY